MKEFIYRPQHKNPEELVQDFVIRTHEFEKIMQSIQADSPGSAPQHIIVQGQRGMGKTTLMYRIMYQIEKDNKNKNLISVIFSEEQYGIRSLYKLWESVIQNLDENISGYEGIDSRIQEIEFTDEYEEKCFEILSQYIKKNKHRLILFLDNFGSLMEKFSRKDQQRLREVLITFQGIKIIGGSTVVLESFYKYDKPFFDFFKIIHLQPLSSEEVKTLLQHLAEKHNAEPIREIITKQPGRIEAMRILSGGVPRTMILLFHIFLDENSGNSIDDLKLLLDKVTPLYKHRMDDLPAQQQEIVEKLALNWDGMSVSELVQKTRMESKALSAQLNNLVKSGLVQVTPSTGKNNFYQLEERFFNIWYLMQHAPKSARQKVIWLTRFLETWCTDDVLNDSTRNFIYKLHNTSLNTEYAQYLTHAYAQANHLDPELREELITYARLLLNSDPKDLPLPLNNLESKIVDKINRNEFESAKKIVKEASIPNHLINYYFGYIEWEAKKYDKAEEYFILSDKYGNKNSMFFLAIKYLVNGYESKAEKYLKMAIKNKNKFAMLKLAYFYEFRKNFKKAEYYYKMAFQYGEINFSTLKLGFLHEDIREYKKAIDYYRIGIKNKNINSIYNFIRLIIEMNDFNYSKEAGIYVEELTLSQINLISFIKIKYYLWTSQFEKAVDHLHDPISSKIDHIHYNEQLSDTLAFAIAKGLKHYVLKLFNTEEYNFKNRLKVLYYALMIILKDEYPNESRRMGKELEEPVQKMLAHIKALEEKYKQA